MNPLYPYLCGEVGCRERGVVPISMVEMTAHWRSHRSMEAPDGVLEG